MKIGYANHPQEDVVDEIDWAAAQGFDFVDLFLEPPRAAADVIDPPAVRAALERHGLKGTGHLVPRLYIGSALTQLRLACFRTKCAAVCLD